MFKKIKLLSLAVGAAFVLQSCHSGDDALFNIPSNQAPTLLNDISGAGYTSLRSNTDVDDLFKLAGAFSGTADSDLCSVKLHKMLFDTTDGAKVSGTTNSSGVVMVPYGDNAACSGSRPVVLYAHGTSTNRDYDLSQLGTTPANPAAGEAALLLAFYASKGYVVVAPNYAGYADSKLPYHPYVNEKQQSSEMIDALNHVKMHANDIGASLSAKLFITGLSQGGYVAMATHKAMQAENEAVTASVPISGPYALDDYFDEIASGTAINSATVLAPMYFTALQKASGIYTNTSDVYTSAYAATIEELLPKSGVQDAEDAGLPESSELFTDLLTTEFADDYLASVNGSTDINAASKVRALNEEGNLRDWKPTRPVVMCGASDDKTVLHTVNSDSMAQYWNDEGVAASLFVNLDLTDAIDPNAPALDGFDSVRGAWQDAATPVDDVHQTTGVYCAAAALATFNRLK